MMMATKIRMARAINAAFADRPEHTPLALDCFDGTLTAHFVSATPTQYANEVADWIEQHAPDYMITTTSRAIARRHVSFRIA